MGRPPFPLRALRRCAVLALAAASASCGIGPHVERLDALHDPKDFSHRPDDPKTLDRCLEEVMELASAEYEEPRDAAAAVFLLARVATEDSAALHRVQGCRALGRLGGILGGSAEPVEGKPVTEAEAGAALQRLRELHGTGETADHAGDGEVVECAALLRRLGDFRVPLLADPGPAGYVRDLRILRGTLLGVLSESRGEIGTPGEAEADRALRSLGFQVARTALAGAALLDGDPRVRGEAAQAAASFGGADMVQVLRTAYAAERDGRARRAVVAAAAAAAARAEGPARAASVPLLLAALDDDDRGIRFEAREGLKALAGEDFGEQPDPWMRWWAGKRDQP